MIPLAKLRRDQTGGAISLWVVLMVPVAAFAAVVAMAGPQRMAAESSMEEAAGDLATLAVVMRDGLGDSEGELEGFLPDCPQIPIPNAVVDPIERARYKTQQDELKAVCGLLLGNDSDGEAYLRRDLGYLGINTNSWEGFYSDSAIPDPCEISANKETRDAVYVALAADWEDASWAAAQAWPNGVRLGDELVARLNQKSTTTGLTRCDDPTYIPYFNPPPDSDPARTVFAD